jgi:hypothetical protein
MHNGEELSLHPSDFHHQRAREAPGTESSSHIVRRTYSDRSLDGLDRAGNSRNFAPVSDDAQQDPPWRQPSAGSAIITGKRLL